MKTKSILLIAPFVLAGLTLNAQSTESTAKPKSKEQIAHEKAQEESAKQNETVKPDVMKREEAPASSKSTTPAPQSKEKQNNAAPQATEKSNNASPTGQQKSAKPAQAPKPEKASEKKKSETPGVEAPR